MRLLAREAANSHTRSFAAHQEVQRAATTRRIQSQNRRSLRAYTCRQFLRSIWSVRKSVLLELTRVSPDDVHGWATRHRIAAPWLVRWATQSVLDYQSALVADTDSFYERWDRERAENPETWLMDLFGVERLCGDPEPHDPEDIDLCRRREARDDLSLFAFWDFRNIRSRNIRSRRRRRIDAPDLTVETADKARARFETALRANRAELDERRAVPRGRVKRNLDEHCLWVARRYVLRESAAVIAKTVNAVHRSDKAIEDAMARTAAVLELPPLPRGRPSSKLLK